MDLGWWFQTVGAIVAFIVGWFQFWDFLSRGWPHVFLFGRPTKGLEHIEQLGDIEFRVLWARITNPGRRPVLIRAACNENDLSLVVSKDENEIVVGSMITLGVVEPGEARDLRVDLPLNFKEMPLDKELCLRFTWRPAHSSGHGCRASLLERHSHIKTTRAEVELMLGDKIKFPGE